MKTKPLTAHARSLAAHTKDRGLLPLETLAAKRSLAAHKANWTRKAQRKAGRKPAGQTLASATTAAIETELITRAIERTGRGIAAMEVALGHMRAKQLARVRALEKIIFAPSALKPSAKGGAS